MWGGGLSALLWVVPSASPEERLGINRRCIFSGARLDFREEFHLYPSKVLEVRPEDTKTCSPTRLRTVGVPLGFLVGGITGLLFWFSEREKDNKASSAKKSFPTPHGTPTKQRTHPEGVSVGVLVLVVGMLVTVGLNVGLAVSKLTK